MELFKTEHVFQSPTVDSHAVKKAKALDKVCFACGTKIPHSVEPNPYCLENFGPCCNACSWQDEIWNLHRCLQELKDAG